MPLPLLDRLLLEVPLYEKLPISIDDLDYLFNLIYFKDSLDGYCTFCRKPSTFRGTQQFPSSQSSNYDTFLDAFPIGDKKLAYANWLNKIHHINSICTRVNSHLMVASFYFTETYIIKIGQYPSIADLSIPELSKYRKVLTPERYKELIRGIGLISHGVGIGAFTYLRRIFESLIEEAHQKLSKTASWDESIYQRSRMEEKINLLQTELPKFLVQNRKLYSILSLGIHELTELSCLKYFPTVRLGVELILEEKLKDKIMQEKIREAENSLAQINTQLTEDENNKMPIIVPTIDSPTRK